jgi:hypothetical protein
VQLPEPTGENRFVQEHDDQIDVVMPDGSKVSLGELARRKQQDLARQQLRDRSRPRIHIHYDRR